VATCAVGNPSGGGTRPVDPADANAKPACTAPDDENGADGDGAKRPAWYVSGSSTSQAQNINIANTCSFTNGNCYVFTDRGTYKNLRAQGLAQNLKIVTRDNDPAARGGRDALINVFHAYGVNPAKFADPSATKTDATAAKLFLDYLTSPSTQQAMGDFLRNGTDQVFVPAAAPKLTGAFSSEEAKDGKKVTITGNVANAVPGYPALNGVTVNLLQADSDSPLAFPKVVATTTSDATGNFTFKEKLKAGKNFRVSVGSIKKLELPSLSPQFSDLLAPTTSQVGTVSGVKVNEVTKAKNGKVTLSGKLKPGADGKGKVTVMAAKNGGKLKKIGKVKVKDGKTKFKFTDHLAKGKWKFQLTYVTGDTLPGVSKKVTVKIS
jgi:tungstate transport system substrate-binding protein